MLSGEGNENGEKTTIGLIRQQKSNIARAAHFLYISLPLCCTTITRNFQNLPGYSFCGGNVVPVLVNFLFHCRSFSPWWPLQNFHVVLPTKKCCLSLFFSLSFAGLSPTFSFSLSLSFSYSKFVDMTINLSLTLQTTQIQKQFPLSVFVFIPLFSCLCFQRRGWLCDFPPK